MMTELSILICDDEVALADELAEFLAGLGWRVNLCHAAEEAMMMLLNGLSPDVFLTDLRIADQDGAVLAGLARKLPDGQRPRVHAIMTGYVGPTTTADELGVDALYVKPVDPERLVDDLQLRLAPFGPYLTGDERHAP